MIKVLNLSLFCLLLVMGCAGRPSSIITSTSPLPEGVRGTMPTTGSNCQYFLLGLIPVTMSPNSQDAVEEAKREVHAQVLTDVTIDENFGYYIIFSNHCVKVRGLGVRDEDLRDRQ